MSRNRNEYRRTRYQRNRDEWIAANGPCQDCGSADRLEVDHVDPTLKTSGRFTMWHWGKVRREAELANCQVLCHTCHARKTAKQVAETRSGEDSSNHKLTEHEVRAIRAAYPGKTQRQLADEYGVTHVNICHIVARRSWKHI